MGRSPLSRNFALASSPMSSPANSTCARLVAKLPEELAEAEPLDEINDLLQDDLAADEVEPRLPNKSGMKTDTSEKGLEALIVAHLTVASGGGWSGKSDDFSACKLAARRP